MQHAHVNLHGHQVAYREAGEPGRPVLLLVHGITSSSATWDPVIPLLAEQSHVIAPDLPGHGRSDKPRGDYSLGALASSLRDLLERLGHDTATVVGHSLGGGIAMQFGYQYHDRCERLVLVASGGLGPDVGLALRAAALPGSELVLPLVANRYVHYVGSQVGRVLGRLPIRLKPSVVEAARGYASLADTSSRSAFVHTLRSVVGPAGQRVSAHDRLYLVEGRPMLLVWGQRDTIIPVSHGRDTQAAVPGSRLDVFEQSGHFPHQDEPERFAQAVLDFLSTTDPVRLDRAALRERLESRRPPLPIETGG